MPDPSTASDPNRASERIFLCTQGDSSKFWRVRLEGSVQTVRYGRIGTEGHELAKTFDSPAAASKAVEKLMAEKLGKGYRPVSETEAKAAHDAAQGAEEADASPSRKPRRSAKRETAPGQQLLLGFGAEEGGDNLVAMPLSVPPQPTAPSTLALEF